MRRLTFLVLLAAAVLPATSLAQTVNEGWNIFNMGGNPPVPTSSESTIDVLPFYNVSTKDICGAISSALTSDSNNLARTIDARGINGLVFCDTNPFGAAGAKGYSGKLLLGDVTIVTSVQWNMPNQYFWIEGVAMSNGSAQVGTVIQASDGSHQGHNQFLCTNGVTNDFFPISNSVVSGCPVIFISGRGCTPMGSTCKGYDSLGTGIRNLAIDCNFISGTGGTTGCIGAGSYDVQEGGGIDSVQFVNQTISCVAFDTSGAPTGATGISNPFIRNVDCVFAVPGTPPSGGVGIYVNAKDGPAEISNVTVSVPGSMSSLPQITDCLHINGGTGTNINYFHCEHAVNGEVIGDANLVTGANIRGLTLSVIDRGVWLKNASDTSVHGIEITAAASSGYVGPLVDGANVIGGTANLHLASYVSSTTTPPSASAMPITNVVTTDAGAPTSFYRMTLNAVTISDLISLPTPPQGTLMYCSDCRQNTSLGNRCFVGMSGNPQGFLAVYNGTNWICK